MFGYIKPCVPQLKVCELKIYKGLYCGLCKKITAEYGHLCAAALSYDMVFLAAVDMALNGSRSGRICCKKEKCPFHPIKPRLCICTDRGASDYAAAAQVILSFHKLLDDLADRGLRQKLRAAAMLPFMIRPYRKAAAARRALAESVKRAMKEQRRIERRRVPSPDIAAEPTAAMTAAVFRELGGFDPDKRLLLGEFGYMLGRFVYFCDALDDLKDDLKSGSYNPFAVSGMSYDKAAYTARTAVYLTLGRLGEIYSRFRLGEFRGITDNIVYLGLQNVFENIRKENGFL